MIRRERKVKTSDFSSHRPLRVFWHKAASNVVTRNRLVSEAYMLSHNLNTIVQCPVLE
jgi:hypothetical protein